jgi:hypothetical protein
MKPMLAPTASDLERVTHLWHTRPHDGPSAGDPSASLLTADPGAMSALRTGMRAERLAAPANLEQIKAGKKADIPVSEGEGLGVASAGSKLVPYGLDRFFTSVFHVGAGASVAAR